MNSKESLATLLKSSRQSAAGHLASPQFKGLQNDFGNHLTSKPGLLVSGIVAGMVAMMMLNCLIGTRHESRARQTSETRVTEPPAPPVIPPATSAAPAKSGQSAYGKPDQWRAIPSEPGVTTVWSYDPPRAVDGPSLPASVLNQNLPANTPLYPPAGYVIQEDTGAQQVGRNGLLSNPCVDPPSTHGAAYGRNH